MRSGPKFFSLQFFLRRHMDFPENEEVHRHIGQKVSTSSHYAFSPQMRIRNNRYAEFSLS